MFISFLGCDGSGKSAVIAGVAERLEKQGVVVTRGHWRPVAIGGERTAAGGHGPVAADDPHGQVPRGMISSIIKLGWLWLNWWVGWLRFLKAKSATGVVVFDRYHADLLIDPMRYRYGGAMVLARLAIRLMPQPDVVVFLDAEPDVLLSRKQEVSRESLERSREKYHALCAAHSRFRVVDASQKLENVIERVIEIVAAVYDRR